METAVIYLCLFAILCSFQCYNCYDNVDYEIFDLVEEVNQTFYELFAIDSTASTSDVKRAYRRLAIKYHPDKNTEDGAEELFRQIAAIYDILKDDDKRKRYDLVLETGLPDWRQPVFYFRRVRKLGLLELVVILTLILTVGHFLVLWASYIERKYVAEEIYRSQRRKEKKIRGRNKAAVVEEKEQLFELELQEHLSDIPTPRMVDLWPCRLVYRSIEGVQYIVHTPTRWEEERLMREEQQRMEQLELEEEEQRIEELKKLQEASKNRKRVNLDELRGEMISNHSPEAPVVYSTVLPSGGGDENQYKLTKSGEAWSEDDMALLAKAVIKFPGGTPQRWKKIAEMIGRPVNEVTSMSKNIKQSYSRPVDPKSQGITGSIEEVSSRGSVLGNHTDISHASWGNHSNQLPADQPGDPSNQPCDPTGPSDQSGDPSNQQTVDVSVVSAGDAAVRRRKKGQRSRPDPDLTLDSKITSSEGESQPEVGTSGPGGETSHTSHTAHTDTGTDHSVWSQLQQKLLEQALVEYPRGTPDRWGVIANTIPAKTKEDCIVRFKYLAEMVKRKKEQAS